MKYQISNDSLILSKIVLFIIFIIFISVFSIAELFSSGNLFGLFVPFPVIIIVFFSLLYYWTQGRFFRVKIDDNYLYYSQLFRKNSTPLMNIISVDTSFLPLKLFFSMAYIIIIRFEDENGKIRKIKFLSKDTGFFSNGEDAAAYKILKSIIDKNSKKTELLSLNKP
jgi:hypothetical protein